MRIFTLRLRPLHAFAALCTLILSLSAPWSHGQTLAGTGETHHISAMSVRLNINAVDVPIHEALQLLLKEYARSDAAQGPLNLIAVQSLPTETHIARVTLSLTEAPVHYILRVLAESTSSDLRIDGDTIVFRIGAKLAEAKTLFFLPLSEHFFERTGLDPSVQPSRYVDWFKKRGVALPEAGSVGLERSRDGVPVTLLIRGASEREAMLAEALVTLVIRGNAVLPSNPEAESTDAP